MNRSPQAYNRSTAAKILGLAAGCTFAGPAVGDVLFDPAVAYPVGGGPIGATVADIDGDGAPDVISANSFSGDLSLLVNNGDGTLAAEVRLGAGGGQPRNVAVGDLDGDGDADFVAAIRGGAGTIAVFLAESAGVFAPAVQYGTSQFSFAQAIADFDNDEDLDVAVVFAGGTGAGVSVLRNAGGGTFLTSEAYDVFEAPVVYTAELAAADVDGDGWTDLVVVNDCPTGCDASMAIMMNAGDGTFLAPSPLALDVAIPVAVRADDLDGDGDADLALVECVVSDSDLVIALNDGAGGFSVLSRSSTGRLCSAGSVTTPDGIALLDVDTNGAPDAVLPSLVDDEVRVLINRGDLTFDAPIALSVGDEPVAAAAGDLDGDGRADIVIANRSISSPPTISVLINQTPVAGPAGDVNGDTVVDVLDLVLLILAWGPCPASCPPHCDADVNEDCTVDVLDLIILILNWS